MAAIVVMGATAVVMAVAATLVDSEAVMVVEWKAVVRAVASAAAMEAVDLVEVAVVVAMEGTCTLRHSRCSPCQPGKRNSQTLIHRHHNSCPLATHRYSSTT